MKLKDITIKKKQAQTTKVDLSQWLGEGAVITLKEADAPAIFAAGEHSALLQKDYPAWPSVLLQSVALMGNCFVSDPDDTANPVAWFALLAASDKDAFMHVLNNYNMAFPGSASLGEAVAEAKKE